MTMTGLFERFKQQFISGITLSPGEYALVTLRGEGVIRIGDSIQKHPLRLPGHGLAGGSEFRGDAGDPGAGRDAGYRQNTGLLGTAHPERKGMEK